MNADNLGPEEYLGFLGQVAARLDTDFVLEAEKFEFGQWERPFEAMLLRLMEGPPSNECINMDLVEKLAKQAGVMEEGVLDPDTWPRFAHWYRASAG